MAEIRHEANRDAQRAFRRLLNDHLATGQWSARLTREWQDAEQLLVDIDFLETLPEPVLDALHEAVMADMDDLRDNDPSWLPDIPLAAITESELREMWGGR